MLGIFETRHHYTNYFKNVPNFKEYRMKMVTSYDSASVFTAFDAALEVYGPTFPLDVKTGIIASFGFRQSKNCPWQ